MIKLIVMFLCFGSFIFTGNPWAAVAVFLLGMTMDEAKKAVVAPKATSPSASPLPARPLVQASQAHLADFEKFRSVLPGVDFQQLEWHPSINYAPGYAPHE